MEADAAVAEERLQKLNQAGMQSWSGLMGALAERALPLIAPIRRRRRRLSGPLNQLCDSREEGSNIAFPGKRGLEDGGGGN